LKGHEFLNGYGNCLAMEISKKIRDSYFKMAGIPVTVFFVTFSYNFFDVYKKINWSGYDYMFFIAVAIIMWLVNVKIHYILRSSIYSIKKIPIRLLARYGTSMLLSFILSFVLLTAWNYLLHDKLYDSRIILVLQVLMVLISLQVSSIYEILYLNKERESDLVKIERTERLKIQAQLDGLKSQVDPHFIFNSLNTLSYLITQSQESAKLFNDTLAKVYRYILIKKENDLVQLKEEIEFTSNYFYLLKIRYRDGLKMVIEIDDIASENYLLPPLSVQILIENAIKHNHFTEKLPVTISIKIVRDCVTVTNNRRVKQFDIQTSQIGLKNLGERYKLITGQSIDISAEKDIFKVVLPILKT
jgi:sensor histidine kinase YesM